MLTSSIFLDLFALLPGFQVEPLLAGVCGGIARYFNVDPTVVRVATVLLVAFAGLSLWVYIIAALIIPRESALY